MIRCIAELEASARTLQPWCRPHKCSQAPLHPTSPSCLVSLASSQSISVWRSKHVRPRMYHFFVFVQRSYALEGEAESDQLCVIDRNMFCIRTPRVSLSDGRVCVFFNVLLPVWHAQQAIATGTQPWHRPRRCLSRGHHRSVIGWFFHILSSDDSSAPWICGPSFMDCRHRCRGRCPRRKHSAGSLRFGDLHEIWIGIQNGVLRTDHTWVTWVKRNKVLQPAVAISQVAPLARVPADSKPALEVALTLGVVSLDQSKVTNQSYSLKVWLWIDLEVEVWN